MTTIKLLFIVCLLILLTPRQTLAQTTLRTDSSTITTQVGTGSLIGSGDSSLAGVAAELANVINKGCNGYVRSTNIDCPNGLSFPNVPHKNEAIAAIITSVRNNQCNDLSLGNCLQCVGLVQAVVRGATGQYLDKGGDAAQYATNVPTGYQYVTNTGGTTPQEGDIIIKTGHGAGHIAVITKVYGSNSIDVAEGNYNFNGEVAVNTVPLALWAGWLRKQ